MKVLFLSSEVVPFAKTGGLADVSGALPGALKGLGVDVTVVMPFYQTVRDRGFKTETVLDKIEIPQGNQRLGARILETRTRDDIPVWLVERDDFYSRPGLYGDASGDYPDNLERFTFFSHAAVQTSGVLSFKPDVIHCHDWQTGLVPALIRGPYGDAPFFKEIKTIFTIHNVGYQGVFPPDKFVVTGLPRAAFFHPHGLEYWTKMSLLKGGIVYADAITTVSPTYAEEIQTKEYGMGMEGVLQSRKATLHGILNGADYHLWDPAADVHIPLNYSPENMDKKTDCKEALIQEMGLDSSLRTRPLLGVISRLDVQKGLDLLSVILDDLLKLDVGVVVLGAGNHEIEKAMEAAADRYPGRVGLKLGFDEPLAHRIMGGADIFLIPSRYEPCGLTQMYALKYGTVPVVRATGGLNDTVVQFDPETCQGNGFRFGPYEPAAFLNAIQMAVNIFQEGRTWGRVMGNAMKAHFSWERSAGEYLRLYQSICASS